MYRVYIKSMGYMCLGLGVEILSSVCVCVCVCACVQAVVKTLEEKRKARAKEFYERKKQLLVRINDPILVL